LLENLREDESGGRDKAVMRATSIALMIVALAGLVFIWS
jgi:hypothetical protein